MFGQYPLSSDAPFAELSFSDKCGHVINWVANFVILAGFFTISLLALVFLLVFV